jgi:hypothetical protein
LNVTQHPSGEWVVQQLREAFSESADGQYLIFDRDARFSAAVHQFLESAGISGWQSGVAERWVRSFRIDLLDDVIVLHSLISGAWQEIISATITPIALTMD